MNFDSAIDVHVGWKMKLSAYLAKPDNSLDPTKVSADNLCDLGKWIYSEGKAHAHMPEFSRLTADHAQFHKAAAEVVRKANTGIKVTDEVALGSKSDFAQASTAVVVDLMNLKRKL